MCLVNFALLPLCLKYKLKMPRSTQRSVGKAKNSTKLESASKKQKLEATVKDEKNDSDSDNAPTKSVQKNGKNDVKPDIDVSAKQHKLVGAHISAAGGLENAPINAAAIGAKAFAMFLKSQRQWNAKPLEDSTVKKFKSQCEKHGFTPDCILPHGSYLLNCGSPDDATLEKSRTALIDELQRCEKLGITLYNFHPGSTCGKISIDECLDKIGESINLAHKQTKFVITVVENMSRQGNTVGGDFKELRGIIDRVKDKSRVGICIDTCHAFAAGYDIKTPEGYEAMIKEFDTIVGLKYLKAMHLNDSKGKVGNHLDRHEQIGQGFIGKESFKTIMNDPRMNNIPLILETPDINAYEREIKMLFSFV